MTTLWTYEGVHPEACSHSRAATRPGIPLSRPWARPEAYVSYRVLWSPKPAQPPLYSTLPGFRLSTHCVGPEEGEACLRYMHRCGLPSSDGTSFWNEILTFQAHVRLTRPTAECRGRPAWVLVETLSGAQLTPHPFFVIVASFSNKGGK